MKFSNCGGNILLSFKFCHAKLYGPKQYSVGHYIERKIKVFLKKKRMKQLPRIILFGLFIWTLSI